MKQLALLFLAFLFISRMDAQTTACTPDTTMRDSILFIRPLPYDAQTRPLAGINDTACVGRQFSYTFTIQVPDTVAIPGIGTVRISKVSFATQGAISYTPTLANFSYACNPPNCVFNANEIGCVRIFGTPSAGDVGQHNLQFAGTLDIGIPFPVTFPNPSLFPGNYYLNVQPSTSSYCRLSDVDEIAGNRFDLKVSPNPTSGWTQFSVQAERGGAYEMRVFDLFGKVLHRQAAQLMEGANTLEFDAGNLPNGMYLLSLTDGRQAVSRKLIVNRN